MQNLSTYAIAGLAGALVLVGLVMIGGPEAARQNARDNERLTDLRRLDGAVRCRAADGALPARIEPVPECPDLPNMADRLTGEAYGYEVLDAQNYRLCATLERPQNARALSGDMQFDGTRACLPGRIGANGESGRHTETEAPPLPLRE